MAMGDQIYVWRDFQNLGGVYQHHGIDVGDGTVIHYRKPSEVIERTSIETFSKGRPIYVREYPEGFCFLPEVVVKRAFSRLGERKYNLLFNNCEHFATWCKTGISDSRQVREFIPIITKLDTYKLLEPIKQALQVSDPYTADDLVNKALADIKTVWEQIQPQFSQAKNEIENWEKVAILALQKNREDLAREALKRKKNWEKKAQDLERQLKHLAIMTENLLKNLKTNP
ncbi:MAG: lecithin retinol acyltransferase family protein [Geminocystis sp.]|nr:lecithin retinol acyltransferase family protein [Geminocystis sp.]HIK37754.1 lecithin retinol acyltransferase family protein [Geminocystis sp. M7585_C2015_104]